MNKKQINKMTLAEMQTEINSISKTLNSRLTRLEKLSETIDDPAGLSYTAVQKLGDIAEQFNSNYRSQQPRFSRAKPKTIQQARKMLKAYRKAYNVKATKRSIDERYDNLAENINNKYNTNFNRESAKKFIEVLNRVDRAVVPSDIVIQVIEIIDNNDNLPFNPKSPVSIANYLNTTDFPLEELEELEKGSVSSDGVF